MKTLTLLKYPSAISPILMSFGAIANLLIFIALNGIVYQADEGAAAHIFQLLMVLQVPIIIYFGIKYIPQFRKQALLVLLFQMGVAAVAAAPVFTL